MALANLVTLERLKYSITATATGDERLLNALNVSVSDAIRKYCRRDFHLRNYDELYDGNGQSNLLLRAYPIQEVQSCRYRPVTVFKVINSNVSLIQQARVEVSSSGLTVIQVASGTMTRIPFLYSSCATLNSLAVAINAYASTGWNAQVQSGDGGSDYGLWPSADLYVAPSFGDGTVSQGAMSCRNQFAELKMHTYELQGFQWDSRGFLYRAIPYTDPELMHPEDLVWPVGIKNLRIQYTAGYAEIPPAVEEAAVEWISALWFLASRDPSLQHQVPASGWGSISSQFGSPPDNVVALLGPYRRFTVGVW